VERGKNMPQMQHNFAAYYFLLQLISLTCQLMAHFRFRSPTHTHFEGKTCRKVYNENIFSLATGKESPENRKAANGYLLLLKTLTKLSKPKTLDTP